MQFFQPVLRDNWNKLALVSKNKLYKSRVSLLSTHRHLARVHRSYLSMHIALVPHVVHMCRQQPNMVIMSMQLYKSRQLRVGKYTQDHLALINYGMFFLSH